ncbi:Txnl4a [Symbiodinium necroappetens]|uniref:Txnl4a protein n=1 Tax=Symbiodinium necroappetens TaxID=1628268 RepID=A0A812YKQ9_9DINO|nr:Txnl4a [Symbiodinium necroappetens]
MGRRHFIFGPDPRTADSTEVPSALVDAEKVQSRRHFPPSQEASKGGTADCLEIYSKKHCPPPSAEQSDGASSGVRRFDAVKHKQYDEEVKDSKEGRRHVPGPSSQLDAALQVKGRESRRCRQAFEGSSGQASLGRETGVWEPGQSDSRTQRRYIQPQDHLQWSGAVPGQFPDSKPQGIRCSSTSPTYLDVNAATALGSGAPEAASSTALVCFGPRSQTPRKRRVGVQADNLVGGTLRGPASSKVGEIRPSRRPVDQGTSLLGGYLRSSSEVDRAPSPLPQRPQDNLAGSACLPTVRAN